jgi:hypothetical protein
MSTAEVASPADNNAQSAQDVQKMLAELKGGNKSEPITGSTTAQNGDAKQASKEAEIKESKTNDSDDRKSAEEPETKTENDLREEEKGGNAEVENGDRSRDNRPHRGRGRGRGGGRGRGDFKSYKQNIKSDLTGQDETDDPVQIRKQVRTPPL